MSVTPEALPPRLQPFSASERRLQELCAPTFLSLWSYPGVCKDQGTGEGRPGGKEVCDLLVVFEDHVVIFSDKTCEFPDNEDLGLAWRRWYARAIVHSTRQLRGAERWIRTHPDRLFLDRSCKRRFPYELPAPERAKYHRIVVAGGAGQRCRRELGGNGSLMLVSAADALEPGQYPVPFSIGRPDHKPGLVHVLDDFTLGAVLGTVDTISDFVNYLSEKERLVESGKLLMAAGEEELLAHYLKHTGPHGRHAFVIPEKTTGVVFDEGSWEEFQQNPQRLAQIEADEISYAWDRLIERFTHYATTGGLVYANYKTIAEFEKGIRFMAREPRTKRRMLAKALLGIMGRPRPGTERATRIVYPLEPGDPYYVFLALHRPIDKTEDRYRNARRNLLHALCMNVRARWTDAKDIIGIATEPLHSPDMSEDLLYLDGRTWSDEAHEEARRLGQELGLLQNLTLREGHEKEYPDLPGDATQPARRRGLQVGRNDLCPCRSGKKFKRCCGRPGKRAI